MTVTVTALIAWGRGYKWDRLHLNEFYVILIRFDMFLQFVTLFGTLACSKFQERVFRQTKKSDCGKLRHLSASGVGLGKKTIELVLGWGISYRTVDGGVQIPQKRWRRHFCPEGQK